MRHPHPLHWIRSRLLAAAFGLATLSGPGTASAQDFALGWSPRSGDAWVDTWLGDINRYGGRYRDAFVDEVVRYHGAPRELVVDLLVEERWAPGDVYYACALAAILGRPCRYVVDHWRVHHGQGWGAVAQELGIQPGSPEFHRLKKGFVPTYDRWARPIMLDDDLRNDFPGRGRGPAKAGKGEGPQDPAGKGPAGRQGQGQGKGKGRGNGKG